MSTSGGVSVSLSASVVNECDRVMILMMIVVMVVLGDERDDDSDDDCLIAFV